MAETELSLLTTGIEQFAKCLHVKLSKLNANEIFSPISIHAFLVLLSRDPSFGTKDFFRILYVDVKMAVDRYKDIFAALSALDDLSLINTSFFNLQTVLRETFKNYLKDNFFSNINFLNFAQKEGANDIMNTYVRNNTADNITHFSGIEDGTNFTFLNAMHFQNDFTDPFSVEDTKSESFHLSVTDKIEVQMMRRKGEFYYKYDPTLKVKILKLPFANSNISLVVILPESSRNINDIFSHKSTHLTKNMTKQLVDVSIPKFKMNYTFQLSDSPKWMGLQDVFGANFFDIIDGEILGFREMEQKVYLEVNENGSEMTTGTLSTLINAIEEKVPVKDGLIIYEANISTEISNRFAKTNVVWRVNNSNMTATNAEFKVVLTETAFITGFEMEIEGKTYKSYINEKEQAKNTYNKAVAQGQSAGLVETKARDSTEFVVSVNLEAGSVAVFSLTYEEMLQRIHDQYELVLNICPGQIVDDLNIEVRINESQPLKFVKTPPLRSGNDIRTKTEIEKYLEPQSDIKIINSKTACIKYKPDPSVQKKMALCFGQKFCKGLSGQFVVQYDVEREPCNGEILLQDGYFVHFFAPNDLDPLPKHVIFVLDTSTSMMGRKLDQLKDAMTNILSDLRKEDMLHIMEFNTNVIVWDVNLKKFTVLIESTIKNCYDPFPFIQRHILPDAHCVNDTIIKNAKEVVQEMTVNGRTFAIGGLETALYLAREGQKLIENKDEKVHPIVVFLTDGEPNVGVSSKDAIVNTVSQLNTDTKVPIFSLSFGDEADRSFLRKLSLKNFGFSRHIYEAADASLQLQDFYKRISTPLLHDINFKYDAEVTEVTRTWFPIYFRGSELVVSGKYGGATFPTVIDCCGPHGLISVNSSPQKPVTSLERLWAYLTVKQLLDARETAENPDDLTKKAIDIALKYSFVTDVTSLVVVKPEVATPKVIPGLVFGVPPPFQSSFEGSQPFQSSFGSSQPIQSSFGSSQPFQSSFGSSQPFQSGFGSSQTFQSSFGSSQPFQSSFGSSQPFQSSFGNSQPFQSSFGSSQITGELFGAPSPRPRFGNTQTSKSHYGSPQITGALFGTPSSETRFGSALPTDARFGAASSPLSALHKLQVTQPTATGFGSFPQGGVSDTQTGTGLFPFAQGGGAQSTGTAFGSFSQGGANTGLFGTSSTPSFTFGCPPATSTTDDQERKTKLKSEKRFLANHPFIVMLQLEKDDTTLVLLEGYVHRPSY